MRANGWLWPGLLTLILAACATAPPDSEPPPLEIAPSLQLNAPAMAATGEQAAFVWTGFDAADVHQDARLWDGVTLQPPVILPLPPTHPLDQQLIAGQNGSLHLFWLDAATDGEGNRLYSALLRPDLTIERGPVEVSKAPTYRIAVLADGTGGAWLVWSEGHPAEPTLALSRVSARGLPLPPAPLLEPGQYPALAQASDGTPVLFWEQGGQLWRATLSESGLREPDALTSVPGRIAGGMLDALWAARCGESLCAGWNIVRADGAAESWWTSGPTDAPFWNAPVRLEGLTWLTPASGDGNDDPNLLAVAQAAGGLTLATFQDGAIRRESLVAPGVTLRGRPGLLAMGESALLAWADAGTNYANLYALRILLPGSGG